MEDTDKQEQEQELASADGERTPGESASADTGEGIAPPATGQSREKAAVLDGSKLAEALRRVGGFMDEFRPQLDAVLLEAYPDRVEVTACNGFSLGHATVPGFILPLPAGGQYLLSAEGVKEVSRRYGSGQAVTAEVLGDRLKLGEVEFRLMEAAYPDYKHLVPDNKDETMVIISTREWTRALKTRDDQGRRPELVGVVFSREGCRMVFKTDEAGIRVSVLVQMFAGQEKRVVYHVERLKKALSSCGLSATIKIGDPSKPTYLESENYWHLIVPVLVEFPREVDLNQGQRDLLRWGIEALSSILKGEVNARVLVGSGRFYLEIGAHIARTEVILEPPELAGKEAAVAQ